MSENTKYYAMDHRINPERIGEILLDRAATSTDRGLNFHLEDLESIGIQSGDSESIVVEKIKKATADLESINIQPEDSVAYGTRQAEIHLLTERLSEALNWVLN